MKKSLILAGLAVAALAMFSCNKIEEISENGANGEENIQENPAGEPVFTLSASIGVDEAENESRLSQDGAQLTWSVGDRIVVNGITSRALTDADINGSQATFGFDSVLDAPFRAIYPASAYVDGTDNEEEDLANVFFPATQNVTAGQLDPEAAIMIGKGTTDGVSFQHAVAYIKFTFDKSVKSIRIMANNGLRMHGRNKSNFATQEMENYYTTGNYSTTIADCGEGIAAGQPIIVAVPAKNYTAGLYFFVVTTDDKYQIITTGPANLSQKAGHLVAKNTTLSNLDTYEGPGIYCEKDWDSFVCADESKFTTDETQQENSDAWKGADGEINIYKDITVATNIRRHGSNGAGYPGATNNIYLLETIDGNNHTITQNASTVPMISYVGSATEIGTVMRLSLSGTCESISNTGWGNAAFAIRVFRKGTLDRCTNKINTTYTETTANEESLYFSGLAASNGGTITDCINEGNMTITLICSKNRGFALGGISCSNRNSTDSNSTCGDFIRCENKGNITILKQASGTGVQCLMACGIGGICSSIAKGEPTGDSVANAYQGYYTRFVNCSNSGTIKFYEERSGTAGSNQLAVAVGGILGICTQYSSNCPFVGANDQGYFFVIDGGHNTGTIDVSSANSIQPLGNGMSGARQTYIGGLAGFVMGSNGSVANSSTNYPVIRGSNNSTIKLGSVGGSEAAGGILGGGGFFKLDYLTASSTVYEKSDNPDRTPTKVGGVAALVGWVVKRSVVDPTNTITISMDASGLSGLEIFGEGVTGVTSNSTKHANGNISTDSKKWSTTPLFIFEKNAANTANYLGFKIKHSDGSSEPASTPTAGYQAPSIIFYGKADDDEHKSGTYLRANGTMRFLAWE